MQPDQHFGEALYEGPDLSHYAARDKPVFFGHYWLQGVPELQTDNVCCLDYSVAKDGKLVAYRWDGEQVLKREKMVW